MYQVISNFNGGLDARKFFLSLPPGTLTTLLNAHISQGGEIEKRKAFGHLPLPANTFGAQPTEEGIVFFGSRNFVTATGSYTEVITPGTANARISILLNGSLFGGQPFEAGDPIVVSGSGYPPVNTTAVVIDATAGVIFASPFTTAYANGETPKVAINIAAPAIYQRLQHPDGVTPMTGVIASTLINDKCLVAAAFADGSEYVFYDGSLVADFKAGLISGYVSTGYRLAQNLATQINSGTDYVATLNALPSFLPLNITGGGSSSDTFTVVFNFGRVYSFFDGTQATSLTLASGVPWTSSNAVTAGLIAAQIAAALTPGGDNAGFTAPVPGGGQIINVTPPIPLIGCESLVVTTNNNAAAIAGEIPASLTVRSIPSSTSVNTFLPTMLVNSTNGTVQSLLTNAGVPVTPAVPASGSFQVSAGGINPHATATFTASGTNAGAGASVSVNGIVYTFTTPALVASSPPNYVACDTSANGSLANLVSAINASPLANQGSGSLWSATTAPNPYVTATVNGAVATLTSILGGTGPNSYHLASTLTAIAAPWTFSGATMAGGKDNNYISSILVGATSLLAGSVNFNSNLNQFASDVASAITSNAGVSNYTAVAIGSIVTITSTQGGSALNGAVLTVTAAGNVCIDNSTFFVSAPPGNISVISPDSGTTNLLTATMPYQSTTTVTSVSKAAGTATIVVGSAANISNGDTIVVSGLTNTGYNGTHTVTGVAGTSINFATSAGSQSTTADTGFLSDTTSQPAVQTETLGAYCVRVAANLNANSAATHYLAFADGHVGAIYVSKTVTTSADAPATLQVTGTLTVTQNTGALMQVSPSVLATALTQRSPYLSTGPVTMNVYGGVAPYRFAWSYVGGGTAQSICQAPANQSPTWKSVSNHPIKSFSDAWQCVVTDSSSPANSVTSATVAVVYTAPT